MATHVPQRPVSEKPKKICSRSNNDQEFEAKLKQVREECRVNSDRYMKLKKSKRPQVQGLDRTYKSILTELDGLETADSSYLLDSIYNSIVKTNPRVEDDNDDVLQGLTLDEAFDRIQNDVATGSACAMAKTRRKKE